MPDAALLLALVGLPFAGAIAAGLLPTHARDTAAWFAGAVALACLALLPAASAAAEAPAAAPPAAVSPLGASAPLQMGVYSPAGQAATERAHGLGLRTLYLTGGIGHWPSRDARAWLDEAAAAGQTPVVTYYQLDPSARSGAPGRAKVASALRDRRVMPGYWRDARLTTIFEGTSEIQKRIISDRMLPRAPR